MKPTTLFQLATFSAIAMAQLNQDFSVNRATPEEKAQKEAIKRHNEAAAAINPQVAAANNNANNGFNAINPSGIWQDTGDCNGLCSDPAITGFQNGVCYNGQCLNPLLYPQVRFRTQDGTKISGGAVVQDDTKEEIPPPSFSAADNNNPLEMIVQTIVVGFTAFFF